MIKMLRNSLGGVSYNISTPDDIMNLPRKYQNVISTSDVEALSDHVSFFNILGERCQFPPMASWLRSVAASKCVSLTTYIDDMDQRAALIVTTSSSVVLKPASGKLPSYSSELLRQIFDVVGSIHHIGFGQPYSMQIDAWGLIEEFDPRIANYLSGPAAGSNFTQFFSADCGDRLLAIEDQVYHYHLSGAIHKGRPLDQVLTEHFKFLSGKENSFDCHVSYEEVIEQ